MPYYLWILIVFAIAAVTIIGLFNQLVAKKQMADNGWSDIDVQLKRRAELIPNLVKTVQGYATHEKKLLTDVVEKRNAAQSADNAHDREQAENALSRDVTKLIALAEAYPDLKANEQFLALQDELSETEDKVAFARRFYNGAVRELNTMIETFPTNLIAGMFGFSKRDYFEVELGARAAPEVVLGSDT